VKIIQIGPARIGWAWYRMVMRFLEVDHPEYRLPEAEARARSRRGQNSGGLPQTLRYARVVWQARGESDYQVTYLLDMEIERARIRAEVHEILRSWLKDQL
jgi:hypothetical protein